MATASRATRPEGKDRLKTIRKAVTTTKGTHTVVAAMDFGVFRNDGNNKIKLQFKSDASGNWYTLMPGDSTPPIGIAKNTDIHFTSVGGNSTLEMILWA